MTSRIARAALHAFVDRQVDLIESTPVPVDLIGAALPGRPPDAEELAAIWLCAGLATQVGVEILDNPERFVEAARPRPAPV